MQTYYISISKTSIGDFLEYVKHYFHFAFATSAFYETSSSMKLLQLYKAHVDGINFLQPAAHVSYLIWFCLILREIIRLQGP